MAQSVGSMDLTPRQVVWLGRAFSGSSVTNLIDTATSEVEIVTLDNQIFIEVLNVVTESTETLVELKEDIVATGGTPLLLFNRNRANVDTPVVTTILNPTVSDQGTTVFSYVIFNSDDQGNSVIVSGTGTVGPFLLKPNSRYIISITNQSGATADYSTSFTLTY